ncbi:AraC family transcriptional regulator [Marmoricola endophyticus]|uniref:AraC family transcriptional regulator n=1 Tax=Marmoricola endophyticus TaxID=2040280 RepID=A0A917F7W0_9ACTN|nr:helix-turn-helix domain-containing protein [Marmoricola endophyticus]GGF58670.1 AraC family transcriptional regulator [Marmoricola endophyticus]
MSEGGGRRTPAGVLRPGDATRRIEIGRGAPPPGLAEHVDYLWWVSWRCPEPYVQSVIPRPVVHVAAEWRAGQPRLVVTGVPSTRFDRRLVGTGRTVAAAFHPAGFRPLLGSAVGALRDREAALGDLLDLDDRPVAQRLLDPAVDVESAAGELGAWLEDVSVVPDPRVAELRHLVALVEHDREVTRADQVAALAGVRLRTLQRRFTEYVGIGPKWVVQRFRLLDVAEAAHGDEPVDWAELAGRLGYADQSHLIRAFTALVGEPPAAYVETQASPPSWATSDTAVGSSIR